MSNWAQTVRMHWSIRLKDHLTRSVKIVPSDVCQVKFKIRCAFSQSDQTLHRSHWIAKGVKFASCGQQRLLSDCAVFQADLCFRWAHMSEGTFCHVDVHFFFCSAQYYHIPICRWCSRAAYFVCIRATCIWALPKLFTVLSDSIIGHDELGSGTNLSGFTCTNIYVRKHVFDFLTAYDLAVIFWIFYHHCMHLT